MGEIKDEELLFLSNLMHIAKEKDFEMDLWEQTNAKKTLGNMLDGLLEDNTLEKLKNSNDIYDGEIEAKEWAKMLESIRSNEKLCSMTLQRISKDDKNGLSVCLTDSDNNAYVVFRGTGAGEWYDNFLGAYVTDTEQQRRALDFINSLPYDNITVVGHSKGGNKAKYTALLSDKVGRCVSFDGQGFSREFYEKYGNLAAENKGKITNYALDGDFVNILLYDVDPEKKFYVTGNGVGKNFAQNHSPSSFFHYDRYGDYSFRITGQNKEMATLHSFVNYILNTISDEEKEILFPFLGNIAQYTLGKQPPDYTEPYDVDIAEYILSSENAEAVGILTAYLVKYEEYDNSIVESVCLVLTQMGVKTSGVAALLMQIDRNGIGIENIVKVAGAETYMANGLLERLGFKNETLGSLSAIAEVAAKKYSRLPDREENRGEYRADNIKRDFSEEMRAELLGLCSEIGNEQWYDITKWDIWYRFEEWFGRLDIDRYTDNINGYYRKMMDINNDNADAINKIFDEVIEIDAGYGQAMREKNEQLSELGRKIAALQVR